MNGYIEHTFCPNCKSAQLSPYDVFYTAPYMTVAINGLQLPMATFSEYFMCNKCGLYMISPRLTDENIVKYYSEDIYTKSLGISEEAISADEMGRANNLIEFMDRYALSPKTHLDIGAARGHFLGLTSERYGTKGYGVDLRGKYAGKPMRHAELLTAIHVLEHTPYPKQELKKYRKYCNKYMILEVPVLNKKAFRFSHLYAFSEELIKDMVRDAGFKILASEINPDTRILAEVVQ